MRTAQTLSACTVITLNTSPAVTPVSVAVKARPPFNRELEAVHPFAGSA